MTHFSEPHRYAVLACFVPKSRCELLSRRLYTCQNRRTKMLDKSKLCVMKTKLNSTDCFDAHVIDTLLYVIASIRFWTPAVTHVTMNCLNCTNCLFRCHVARRFAERSFSHAITARMAACLDALPP